MMCGAQINPLSVTTKRPFPIAAAPDSEIREVIPDVRAWCAENLLGELPSGNINIELTKMRKESK
jgi:hypothetical protein